MADKEQLEQRLTILEDTAKAQADAAEKAARDEKYRLSMLGHENNRWDFSDAMYLLPTDSWKNDIRLQQVEKNFWLMFDRWGLHPDFIKCFPNVLNNNSFEWRVTDSASPDFGKPMFWEGDGTTTEDAAFDGTYSLKLLPGETMEQSTLAEIGRPHVPAGPDPSWWNDYQTRCSFRHKGGAVRVKIKRYVGEGTVDVLSAVNDTTWRRPDSTSVGGLSFAERADGNIIVVWDGTDRFVEGYVADVSTLLGGDNTVTGKADILIDTDVEWSRATVFNDSSGDLYLHTARRYYDGATRWQEVKIYKSPSGNGGDWTLHGTVRDTSLNLGGINDVPTGKPYFTTGGRWILPTIHYRDQLGVAAAAPTIMYSDDDGVNWSTTSIGPNARAFAFGPGDSRHCYWNVRAISYYDGKYWWGAAHSFGTSGQQWIYSSTDGATWSYEYNLVDHASIGALFRWNFIADDSYMYLLGCTEGDVAMLFKTDNPDVLNDWDYIWNDSLGLSLPHDTFITYITGENYWLLQSLHKVVGILAEDGIWLVDNHEEGKINRFGEEIGVIEEGHYLDYPYIANWAFFLEGEQDLSDEDIKYLVSGYRCFYFTPTAGMGRVKFHFENIDPTNPCYIDMVQIAPDFTGKWGMFETLGKRSIAPSDVIGMPGLGTAEEDPVTGELVLAPNPHNLIDTTNHPVTGLTVGHFLKALTATTYGFEAHGLTASDVGALDDSVTSNPYDEGTHTGLDFSYGAGRVRNDNTISVTSAGTVALTDDTTNYVEVDPSDGVVSTNTTGFAEGKIPLYEAVTASGAITTVTDRRAYLGAGGGADLPDFMEWVDTYAAEGLAVFDDPPTNSSMVALIGKKGSETSVYLEDSQADFEPGKLEDVEATAAGLELYNIPTTNMELWLRADSVKGLNDGDAVATWSDESGNGTDFTQATGANQPEYKTNIVNGKPVLRFDGSDYLNGGATSTFNFLHNTTNHSVFIVAKTRLTDPNAVYVFMGNNGFAGANTGMCAFFDDRNTASRNDRYGYLLYRGANPQLIVFVSADDVLPSGQFNVISNIYDHAPSSNNYNAWVNGSSIGNASKGTGTTNNATYAMQVGAGGNNVNPLDGDIAEIIIYSRALSTEERGQVEGYLTAKYSTSGLSVDPTALHGNRIALPQDLTTLSTDPGLEIKWTATTPTGTTVSLETAVKGETSYTDENIGTGDGVEDTFYLPAYPAERHSDVVISVDGTPTAEFTRANVNDPREIIFNSGHEPGNTLAVTATYTGVVEPSETAEVQTLYLGGATGGTFTLSDGTTTTAAIAYDASAADIEGELETIYGTDLVTVADDPGAGDFIITFSVRVRASGLTADLTSLTGATSPTLTETTAYSAGDWEEQTTTTAITNIPAGDLTGQHLWIRQTLETDDPAETPVLEEMEVYYGSEEYGVFTTGGTVGTL